MPPGARRKVDKPDRTFGYQTLTTLRKQYDPKKGGYTIEIAAPRGGKRTEFVASKYAPEEGGYYRQLVEQRKANPPKATHPNRRGGGSSNRFAVAAPNVNYTKGDGYQYALDSVLMYAKEESDAKSRAKPYQRPVGTSYRPKRDKQISFDSGTILTRAKKLGAGRDDDMRRNRKTLLGG